MKRIGNDSCSELIKGELNATFDDPSDSHSSSGSLELDSDAGIVEPNGVKLYDSNRFCWYEGEVANGVPDGSGSEFVIKDDKRQLIFEGEWREGKRVKGRVFIDEYRFYPCEYRNGQCFATGLDEELQNSLDEKIRLANRPVDVKQCGFVDLYRREKDAEPFRVYTGYVTKDWKYVLGRLYDREGKRVFEGFFDAEGKAEYGTHPLEDGWSFTGVFQHGIPKSGNLCKNGELVYHGDVNDHYQMHGEGELYKPSLVWKDTTVVKCVGTFRNGKMETGSEYTPPTRENMQWDVKRVLWIDGKEAVLRFGLKRYGTMEYYSLTCDSCTIKNGDNGFVEKITKEGGKEVIRSYVCSRDQLQTVFSEENVSVADRLAKLKLLRERAAVVGDRGNLLSEYYFYKGECIDVKSGCIFNSGVQVYKGDLKVTKLKVYSLPLRDGSGMEYDGNGNPVYDGKWERGMRHGSGTEYDGSGNAVYEGEWERGMRHGSGKEFADGLEYSGEWRNGKKEGNICVKKEGRIIRAERWRDGEKLGRVVMDTNGFRKVLRMVNGKAVPVIWEDAERRYEFKEGKQYRVCSLRDNRLLYEGEAQTKDSWWMKSCSSRYGSWLFVPDGNGEEFDANGKTAYRGHYWHGYWYGEGEECADGVRVFRGNYVYDQRDGNGVEYDGDHQVKGYWRRGKKT